MLLPPTVSLLPHTAVQCFTTTPTVENICSINGISVLTPTQPAEERTDLRIGSHPLRAYAGCQYQLKRNANQLECPNDTGLMWRFIHPPTDESWEAYQDVLRQTYPNTRAVPAQCQFYETDAQMCKVATYPDEAGGALTMVFLWVPPEKEGDPHLMVNCIGLNTTATEICTENGIKVLSTE